MQIVGPFKQAVRLNPIKSALFVLIIVWLVAVRVYNFSVMEKGILRIDGLQESADDLRKGTTAADLFEAKDFAAMSAEVYRLNVLGDAKPEDTDKCRLKEYLSAQGWQYLQPAKDLPTDARDPDDASKKDWQKAALDGDLVYGLWHRRISDQKDQIALIFRGTHNAWDWWSNLRWVTKHLHLGWDQYDHANAVAKHLQDKEKFLRSFPQFKTWENIEIIAAGHSLGGGLAHHAGYSENAIERVYSFNGTSVTGFYSITNVDEYKQNMRIYRIEEYGEVLSFLRNFMSLIYPVVERNPKIVEATYNFEEAGIITQHSIDDLACALVKPKLAASL